MNRRGFLTLAAQGSLLVSGVVAAGQVIRFLAFQPAKVASTIIPVGQADQYPSGSLSYVAVARAYVGSDVAGLYAVDAVCPHLGCLVEQGDKGGFVCPCHASRFDPAGQVVSGPATTSLRYLRVSLDQEQAQLVVDRASPVDASVRLAI